MTEPACLTEVWRGDFLESRHRGHAVVCDARGTVRAAWGDPDAVILPRSSCKMLQALPLVETAEDGELSEGRIALACASHSGAAMHTRPVAEWLAAMGLGQADLRCGPQVPADRQARERLRAEGLNPDQLHNTCSGKHAGYLALAGRLGGGPEYLDLEHPVQVNVRAAVEEMTEVPSPGYAIDGCCAPNFATSLSGLAYAMARMADPDQLGSARGLAARRIVAAMMARPLLISGEGLPCSELTAAMGGRGAIKFGAESVYTAILPAAGLGVAIKVEDGGMRGSECAIAALLVRTGALAADDPVTRKWLTPAVRNRRGARVGGLRPAPDFYAGGRPL